MKKLFQIALVAIAVAFSSCSSTSQTSSGRSYDDVYSTSSDNSSNAQTQAQRTSPSDYSAPSQERTSGENSDSRFDYANSGDEQSTSARTTDDNGNTYVTNNYYTDDDYYDYAYSSRLRRFHHPVGWGYYDSYYTNSYMYDYNPSSWGVSIYLGYNWWAPSSFYYSPFSWGLGFNWGYPQYGYCNPYWSNWYSPYYSPFYGYGGYGHGYNHGYWDGYYAGLYGGNYGYNPYYFNSNDYNSYNYYYGPRKSTGRNNGSTPRSSVAQLYHKEYLTDNPKTPVISSAPDVNYTSTPRPKSNSNDAVKDVKPASESVTKPENYSSVPTPKSTSGQVKDIRNNPTNHSNDVKPADSEFAPPKNNYESTPRPKNNQVKDNAEPKNNNESTPRPKQNNTVKPDKKNEAEYSYPKSNIKSEPGTENYETPGNYENHLSLPRPRMDRSKKNDSFVPQQERSNNTQSYTQPAQQKTERINSGSKRR